MLLKVYYLTEFFPVSILPLKLIIPHSLVLQIFTTNRWCLRECLNCLAPPFGDSYMRANDLILISGIAGNDSPNQALFKEKLRKLQEEFPDKLPNSDVLFKRLIFEQLEQNSAIENSGTYSGIY